MDVIGKLEAIEEIKQLKARYCRLLDAKQWDDFRALFVDDARFVNVRDNYPIEPADAFLAAAREALGDAITMHHCHNPEIEIVGEDEAVGTWAMADKIAWSPPHDGYGHYEERYSKIDGVWMFTEVRLIYTHPEDGSRSD